MSARPPRHRRERDRSAQRPGQTLDVRGSLDSVEADGRAFGWCWSPDEPETRRAVMVMVDGVHAVSATADILREDLRAAAIGDGGHAFVAEIPRLLRMSGESATVGVFDGATGARLGDEVRVTWAEQAAASHPLVGNVDRITRDGWVSGWCWEPSAPKRRITLDVLIDDTVAGTVEASESRADLLHAAVGDGRYGFTFMLPYETLAERATVQVRVIEHGTGRPLGKLSHLRIGRRTEMETRLIALEREVALLARRADLLTDTLGRQPPSDASTRALFSTVAEFFQNLANGLPPAPASAGLNGELGTTLADLRRRLPALALRPAKSEADGRPLAAIAVPARGSVDCVHACLAALRASDIDLQADIVLIDPSGEDVRCALLPALVPNLKVGPSGAGLVGSLARLLNEVDTEFVGLVASGARPHGEWLSILAATLAAEPNAAAAGAVALRPDGLLDHAGFLLGADRRLRNIGHLAAPDLPEHRVLRQVDALAPLALLVRRDLVVQAGGLDDGYDELGPALADLCLALRGRGHLILRQPAAVAAWPGFDASDELMPQPSTPDGEDGRRLRLAIVRHDHDGRIRSDFVGRALVVDADLPRPDRDAGSVVSVEQMLVLRRLGWRVSFVAASGTASQPADRARLERLGIEVQTPRDGQGIAAFLEEHGAALHLVHVYRHQIAALLLPRVRALAPQAKFVFSPADLHHLREAREAALAGTDKRPASATRAKEIACAQQADATILLSDHELSLLAAHVEPSKLHLLRWIARPAAAVAPFAGRDGMLFVGGFQHAPNVDAVLWYAHAVAPLVARLRPGLRLDVVGADAPPAIRDLESDVIHICGWVDDLAPLLARARLTVAPLRYGAGFKGKVATSLAAGVPVVATPIACEGTGLSDGDGVLVAETAEAFARAIVTAHDDAVGWARLSERARERVAALYSPRAADEMFRAMLAGLGLPDPG